MTIQEYRGTTNPRLIQEFFSSRAMLFGMQLEEILWVCSEDQNIVGLYGAITQPFNPGKRSLTIATVNGVEQPPQESTKYSTPTVETKEYNIFNFQVSGGRSVFKGIKVQSLIEAQEMPSFYFISEDMLRKYIEVTYTETTSESVNSVSPSSAEWVAKISSNKWQGEKFKKQPQKKEENVRQILI